MWSIITSMDVGRSLLWSIVLPSDGVEIVSTHASKFIERFMMWVLRSTGAISSLCINVVWHVCAADCSVIVSQRKRENGNSCDTSVKQIDTGEYSLIESTDSTGGVWLLVVEGIVDALNGRVVAIFDNPLVEDRIGYLNCEFLLGDGPNKNTD